MLLKKEKAIKAHVNSQIRRFKKEVMKIALEKDHPYVEVILNKSLSELKKNATDHAANMSREEQKFLTDFYFL